MAQAIIPVILSGGSGTRLWPLSRVEQPKQFLRLVTDNSLLQDTLVRLAGCTGEVRAPIVICNDAHRFLVAEQLRELGVRPAAIVLEPQGRNTAPAVAVAALLAERAATDPDPILLVLPADHVIVDTDGFLAAVERAAQAAAAGNLVTFGVVPTRPETGYGYLLSGIEQGAWSVLEQFVEKPDVATAQRYLDSGRYLWNSGMFVFSVASLLAELDRHAPGILTACRRAVASARVDEDFTRLGKEFLDSPSDSIDYAVMEKTDRAAVVPLDAGWSDVGSWAALHELGDPDQHGNVVRGDVVVEDTHNSYVFSSGRSVVTLGLAGHLVVETADTVFVGRLDRAQDVKRVAEALRPAKNE